MKVYIKTPARLHLGLIDMNGNQGRLFGGLGVAISQPNVVLEAEPAKTLSITGEECELAGSLAKRFFETHDAKTKAAINIKAAIPTHMGLGSGTQLALAIATVLAKLNGIQASTQELALAMGRAQRTGVGTAIFDQGGFVVDGGKAARDGTCLKGSFPPLIFRQPFPKDWRFVVSIPDIKKGLANEAEASAFSEVESASPEEVGKMCRLIMLKLLPALAERDIESFGDALTGIQKITGGYFARVQGGIYSSRASADCIDFMQKLGLQGVGQSSWGPALYGVVKMEDAAKTRVEVEKFLKKSTGGQVFIAKPNNTGATVKLTR